MKKLLLLSALFLQSDTGQNYSQIRGEEIENLFEQTYKHPESKRVGDLMPMPFGEIVSYTFTRSLNEKTGEIRKVGLITGYDRDREEDRTAEYEFINRHCGSHMEVKTYAVFDVPHKLLYIDSSLNNNIDLIAEGVYLIKDVWPMIPMCKKENMENILA